VDTDVNGDSTQGVRCGPIQFGESFGARGLGHMRLSIRLVGLGSIGSAFAPLSKAQRTSSRSGKEWLDFRDGDTVSVADWGDAPAEGNGP
jgi:hypothetical protein